MALRRPGRLLTTVVRMVPNGFHKNPGCYESVPVMSEAEPTPRVEEVTGEAAALAEIGRLRVAAWKTEIVEFPAEIDCWIDEIDRASSARLYAIRVENRIVASARLTMHAAPAGLPDGEVYRGVIAPDEAGPIGVVSRLVVHPEWRRRGYGTALDRHRIAVARELDCRMLAGCSSASLRIQQMQGLGFEIAGRQTTNPHPVFRNRGVQTVLVLRLGG